MTRGGTDRRNTCSRAARAMPTLAALRRFSRFAKLCADNICVV